MAGMIKIPGSIRQATSPSGLRYWIVEADVGTGADGKRKRARRRASTLAGAERIRKELWLKRQEGADRPPQPRETVRQYSEWWLQHAMRDRVRESTLGDYQYRLGKWVFPFFGRTSLGSVTVQQIEAWLRLLRTRDGLSVKTVNGARTIFNQVMKHALAEGRISRNPVALTAPLKTQHGDTTQVQEPWSLHEARAALDAVQNTGMDLFVTLGVAYGLRRGEALGLHWADIDFDGGTLTVNRGLKQARLLNADGSVSIKLIEDATKTKSSQRTLPLSDIVTAAIHRHRIYQAGRRALAGQRWQENDLVFTSGIGTHVNPSNLRRELQHHLIAGGVRVIRIHDMRHTAAVQALEAGEPLEVVSQALGHSDLNTTKAIYARQVEAYDSRFAHTLSNRFRPVDAEYEALTREPDSHERAAS